MLRILKNKNKKNKTIIIDRKTKKYIVGHEMRIFKASGLENEYYILYFNISALKSQFLHLWNLEYNM